MTITEILVAMAILGVLFGAVFYIIREKKRGKKCIGCPYSDCPSRKNGCFCSE